MTTTPLTRDQLKQLTEEYQSLEDWTTIRDFCTQVYGVGKVAKFETETDGEYNDEGGTNYSINNITASDANGKELAFDLTLPFWVHLLANNEDMVDENDKDEDSEGEENENEDANQDAAMDALREWYPWKEEDKALKAKNNWVAWEDLPCDVHNGEDETYDLTQEPVISFPVVVALQ